MINLILIPHSNAYIERVLSILNATKTDCHNLLDVTTVNSIMKLKAYYDENSTFEPDEEHFICYKANIWILKKYDFRLFHKIYTF